MQDFFHQQYHSGSLGSDRFAVLKLVLSQFLVVFVPEKVCFFGIEFQIRWFGDFRIQPKKQCNRPSSCHLLRFEVSAQGLLESIGANTCIGMEVKYIIYQWDFQGPPIMGPLIVSFPYYSHTTPIRIPKDMGIVWKAYHKGVPLLGVPGITLEYIVKGDFQKIQCDRFFSQLKFT